MGCMCVFVPAGQEVMPLLHHTVSAGGNCPVCAVCVRKRQNRGNHSYTEAQTERALKGNSNTSIQFRISVIFSFLFFCVRVFSTKRKLKLKPVLNLGSFFH